MDDQATDGQTDGQEPVGGLIRRCRTAAGLTQAELAERVATSVATLSQYENGRKEPRLSTLRRVVEGAGFDLSLRVRPTGDTPRPLTREERRSIALHAQIATHLRAAPTDVLAKAQANLARLRQTHADGSADPWFDRWATLLAGPLDDLVLVMTDPGPLSRELRQNTPFAGVLEPRERWAIYRNHAA